MAVLFGTPDNDTLTGTIDPDAINGMAGNDSLIGLEADDQLLGGQGNDTIDGGQGNDLVQGGKESDRIFGDAGNDTIFGDLGDDTGFGGNGDDLLYGDQNAATNFSGDGDDILFGNFGNDTLFGLDGFDWIEGNIGDDAISGNKGNDTLFGGEGNDLIYAGQDNDRLWGELGEDTLYGDLGNDSVSGGEGQDLILGIQGDDLLSGETGDDEIYGNQGNDTVVGGEGNDVLYAGRNQDLLKGEAGNDFLSGDKGVDTLTGGDGLDIFGLRKGIGGETIAAADIITDFDNGTDLIALTEGLRFDDLSIFQGTGDFAADTVIQDATNGQFLALLQRVNRNAIEQTDFTVPGVLEFSAPTFQVNEDGTGLAVTIRRTEGAGGTVRVKVIPSDRGSARTPEDYDSTPVLVNFANGETSKTVNIPIVDDTNAELRERINLTLAYATGGATIGTQNQALLEILDNDSVSVPRLTFLNPTPNDGDLFGSSVALGANNVLIGSPFDDPPGTFDNFDAGAAYLFDGTTGALLKTFRQPTPGFGNRFGFSVATVGNNVLIGAPEEDTGAIAAGAVYLFDGNTGQLLNTFRKPNPSGGDRFGFSVAAIGNTILIGAPGDNSNAPFGGTAYLFDAISGALLQTFRNPTPDEGDGFGFSLAIVGNKVLIGAPGDETNTLSPSNYFASGSGSAYLFDIATGALLKTFLNPSPFTNDRLYNNPEKFGYSVAGVGNNVLIGEPSEGTIVPFAGAAYLFDSTTGTILQTFPNPDPGDIPEFGFSVATVGNNALITAPFGGPEISINGTAYLFDSTTGRLLQTFFDPSAVDSWGLSSWSSDIYGQFGSSVAAIGNNVLIGAPGEDIGAPNAGAVYLF